MRESAKVVAFCCLDNAQQPQDQDQDQQTAKTDIHDILPFRVAVETVRLSRPFQSLRWRDSPQGTILPVEKLPDLLDFPALCRE